MFTKINGKHNSAQKIGICMFGYCTEKLFKIKYADTYTIKLSKMTGSKLLIDLAIKIIFFFNTNFLIDFLLNDIFFYHHMYKY